MGNGETIIAKYEAKTADRALQTAGGVLLAICLGLSGWALKEVYAHESRISVIETKTSGLEAAVQRIEAKVDRILERMQK